MGPVAVNKNIYALTDYKSIIIAFLATRLAAHLQATDPSGQIAKFVASSRPRSKGYAIAAFGFDIATTRKIFPAIEKVAVLRFTQGLCGRIIMFYLAIGSDSASEKDAL